MEAKPGERPLGAVLSEFVATAPDVSVAAIVASGDFISKGDANHFAAAEAFIKELAAACGLDLGHVLVVPGNHDIWLQDVQSFAPGSSVENPYRMFLRSLYGADITEFDRLTAVLTSDDWTLTLLGLNSARARTAALKEYGYVGHDRYGPWLDRLSQANDGLQAQELIREHRLNIAVLHHHLVPAGLVARPSQPRPVSLTLDAGALVADLQDAAVHIALHGHQHLPLIATTGRVRRTRTGWCGPEHPLIVLGSGSTGADVNHLAPEELNNTFSLYTPLDSRLRIQVFKFNSAVDPELLVSVELPL